VGRTARCAYCGAIPLSQNYPESLQETIGSQLLPGTPPGFSVVFGAVRLQGGMPLHSVPDALMLAEPGLVVE